MGETQMVVDGIEYEVVAEKAFTHNGKARTEIVLRRRNGKRVYHVVRYEDGSLSGVV